jgi:trimeric autotransporter adhesin
MKFFSATILINRNAPPAPEPSGHLKESQNNMRAKNLRLIGAFAALLTLALAVSCKGFFVDPTLTAISVGPQNVQLNINQQVQMSATGTYSDGSQKTLTSGVTWSSSDSSAVSVGQSSGLATGLTIGSATISASAGSCSACSGSTTVTVAIQGVTSITVTPNNQTATPGGTTVYFHALANGSTDITNPSDGTTWTVVDATGADQTSNFSPTFVAGTGAATGEGFLPSASVVAGTYTVKATYTNIVGQATLNVQ